MRITSKGQVTIPKPIRDVAGLLPGTRVEFSIEDGTVVVRPAAERGEELVDHLRRHGSRFTMTTEEIMSLTRGEKEPGSTR